MKYARVVETRVAEVIEPMYDELTQEIIDISLRFTPEFVETLVVIPENQDVVEGYAYIEGKFSLPIAPKPSVEETVETNKYQRDSFLRFAAEKISPLQFAVDLDIATTNEQDQLISWKKYSVYVNRVDLKIQNPVWPEMPQG